MTRNRRKRKTQAPRYTLLSVFDKEGIVDFAKVLEGLGYQIISTGGTAKVLTESGVRVIPIQEITGNPECFDGRMKTISFQIESGILYDRQNPAHVRQAKELKIKPIDIVVCNLYPFEQTVAKPKVGMEEIIENIDVGGPTMVRAAAKNLKNVLVIVGPDDYQRVGKALKSGDITDNLRRELAAKAFAHLSFYDSQIASYLGKGILFPKELTIPLRRAQELRYGENPHQKGVLYAEPNTNAPVTKLQKRWGRELGWVNVTDINAGIESVRPFDPKDDVAAVVIKHNSPCGLALGKTAGEALARAIEADPESAFGGVIVLNRPMDLPAAKVIAAFKDAQKSNIDIVAVPDIDKRALDLLSAVRKNMGVYTFGPIPKKRKNNINIKYLDGGAILQNSDDNLENGFAEWKVVTKVKPTPKQLKQMRIAWKFISRIRSNAVIVVDKDLPMTRGIGSGQTSRFRSTKIALEQAGKHAKGAVLASDSFFPFSDSIKFMVKYKIGGIVQQGGSVRDQDSIDEANKAGIPMVFTGRRAFWH